MCVNRLKEVLRERGLDEIRPSEQKLKELKTSRHSWTRWINKKLDPELSQLQPLAEFLGCSIQEIIEVKEVAASSCKNVLTIVMYKILS